MHEAHRAQHRPFMSSRWLTLRTAISLYTIHAARISACAFRRLYISTELGVIGSAAGDAGVLFPWAYCTPNLRPLHPDPPAGVLPWPGYIRTQRRRLLQVTKPLASRCAAASKVHKAPLPEETALAACMRRTEPYCLEPKLQVLDAARKLPFLNFIKPRMKCLTVHAKGCMCVRLERRGQKRVQGSLVGPGLGARVPGRNARLRRLLELLYLGCWA